MYEETSGFRLGPRGHVAVQVEFEGIMWFKRFLPGAFNFGVIGSTGTKPEP